MFHGALFVEYGVYMLAVTNLSYVRDFVVNLCDGLPFSKHDKFQHLSFVKCAMALLSPGTTYIEILFEIREALQASKSCLKFAMAVLL